MSDRFVKTRGTNLDKSSEAAAKFELASPAVAAAG
jgi:hypothetical protein